MNTEPNFDELFRVIKSQQGFFTATQAKDCGYSTQLQSYHVKTGQWLRDARGIFELKHFPVDAFQKHWYIIYLWTMNREGKPEGVFSHGTALRLHELTPYVPPIFDLTVPKHFRRHSSIGARLELHRQNLEPSDWTKLKGLPVTKPLKTVIDLLDSRQIDGEYILDGLKNAIDRFMILPTEIRNADLSSKQRERLMSALQKVNYELIDEI